MLKINSMIEVEKSYTGIGIEETPYWRFGTRVYSITNGKRDKGNYVTILCNGQPLVEDGGKVYIHEIIGFDLKRKRNKQGAWTNYPWLFCICGKEPLGGATDYDEEAD